MVIRKHNAPPGCDYDPVTGENPNISYGTVEALEGRDGERRTLANVICKRLYPTDPPTDPSLPWDSPTADKFEPVLPRGASDAFEDPRYLAKAYHVGAGHRIQHLATIVTLRFPEIEACYPDASMKLHEAWFLAHGFARRLVDQLKIAALVIRHIPGRSWGIGMPHCHLILPCRSLSGAGFSTFVPVLIDHEIGRPLVDREWRDWRVEAGYAE